MAMTQQAPGLRGWWTRRRESDRAARRRRAVAAHLYALIVGHSRLERFYVEWGVPDSRDGRFEMIGLHAALVMRRLRSEGRQGQELAQALFDVMFVDMDRSLREIGVGDLSVGKYVKAMAQTFFARARSLDEPVATGEVGKVGEVLARNVYVTGTRPSEDAVRALACYLVAQWKTLERQPGERLLEGALDLDPPRVPSSGP
jgi:cytochrome b pre-mRNA-processing protein 3